MGRGDNRRTLKHRRRKSQRKLKDRIRKRISPLRLGKGAPKKKNAG